MDEVTIKQIAVRLADYLPSNLWIPLGVQTIMLLIAGALGVFVGEYLKTRGKNLATRADFESLKDQLRANTELVETIRAEVTHRDSSKREWLNLRRIKLEELLTKTVDSREYLARKQTSA